MALALNASKGLAKSVLRQLGLLDAARRVFGRSSQHGHQLLAETFEHYPQPTGGCVVEIGSTRERIEGQGSTVLLAKMAEVHGLRFITVDMDPANAEQASLDLAGISGASAVNAKGEDFLRDFSEPIAAIYLDAFDLDHGHHSEYRRQRYRRYLGTELTTAGAVRMHLDCAKALAPLVVDNGLVVFDDTWASGGTYAGKGSAAVPYLLNCGFRVASTSRNAVALSKAPG